MQQKFGIIALEGSQSHTRRHDTCIWKSRGVYKDDMIKKLRLST